MLKYLLLLTILPVILIPGFAQEYYGSQFELDVTTNNMIINNIAPNYDFLSLLFDIKVNDNSWFEITFPREFFDSTFNGVDDDFIILVDSEDTAIFTETQTNSQSRTLSIELLAGSEEVEIIGSYLNGQISNVYPIFNASNYQYTINYLTITTDKPSYTAGDTILISGEFNHIQNVTSLSISLQSPEGNYSTIPNITTNNNTYTTSITTGNNTSISTPGTYTIISHYGTNTASTTFDYYTLSTEEDEYFIPDSPYIILSDHEIAKWTNELNKWENAQNRTDSKIEFYYEKLDTAMIRNQTDKIETYTQSIGHSMALSELYDGLIQCLEEQLELLS